MSREPSVPVESVLVSSGGRRKLHVPEDGDPLCGSRSEFREKPLAVFPPAHREWCAVCLDLLARRAPDTEVEAHG